MKTNANVVVLGMVMVLLMMGNAYAASDTPALQVLGYSTAPATVYPGTNGQLEFTISNAGGDTATMVAIYYDNGPGGNSALANTGDIAAGTSTIASIPFTVPSGGLSGILLIHMNIVYSDSNHENSKTTPVTASIVVSQHQVLAVRTLSISGTALQPGDKLTASLELANTGGITRNVIIRSAENSSFTLDGASQQTVGDIGINGTKSVSVDIRSSSSASAGKYMIPLVVEYQDSLQNAVSQTFYVGPVSVLDASTQFSVDLVPLDSSEVGSASHFSLVVVNRGASGATAIIDLNQSTALTPIGNSRIYFDYIEPGENGTRDIMLGIGPTTSAGYYDLPMSITANGRTYTQDLGVVVHAGQEITVSSSTEPSAVSAGSSGVAVTAQIANTGNSAIRSVYASVPANKNFNIVGSADKFIGTLNVDDFATFQFTVNVPANLAPGTYEIPVRIVFKDSINQEHTVDKNVSVTVYSQSEAFRLGASGNSTTTGSFSGRSSGGFFGISLLTPVNIGIGVIVLAVGYFGYKKVKGKK